MNRRDFVKLIGVLPIITQSTLSNAMMGSGKNNYLIMLELKGGNDSLNTFIPYNNDDYYLNRPTIALDKSEVIEITDDMAFHPSLKNLANMYKDEEMSIFHNVGYPNPNKSHFTSLDIVEKAVSGENGWAFEAMRNKNKDLDGIVFSGSDGLFDATTPNFIKMKNINNFIKQSRGLKINNSSHPQIKKYNHTKMLIKRSAKILQKSAQSVETYQPSNPESKLAKQFVQISKVIKSNINIPILKLHLSGFDTHADQLDVQGDLLKELDTSLKDFSGYLKSQGLWANSLIYTFSEFGRRVAENGNGGTDHGEAYSGFALGGRVIGGSYGNMPTLSRENLKYEIDHRQLLHAIEKDWLHTDKTSAVVANYDKIRFIGKFFS